MKIISNTNHDCATNIHTTKLKLTKLIEITATTHSEHETLKFKVEFRLNFKLQNRHSWCMEAEKALLLA